MAKKTAKKTAKTAEVVPAQSGGSIIKADELPEIQQGFLSHQYPTDHLTGQVQELLRSPDVDEFSLLRIKVPAGGGTKFTVSKIDGDVLVESLKVVILQNTVARAWWSVPFEESGGGSPPDCSSTDAVRGFGKLSDEVYKQTGWTEEMGDPSQGAGYECAACPLAQWGSDRRDRGGQDCKQVRALFVLLEDEIVPAVVVAPPSSLKFVNEYFMKIARAAVGGSHRIVTEISLKQVPGPPPYARLDLRTAGKLADAIIPPNSEFAATVQKMRDIVSHKFVPAFTVNVEDVSGPSR